MNPTAVIQALTDAFDSDVPATKAGAAQLDRALRTHLDELTEWVAELTDLVDQVSAAAGAFTDAGSEDRDGEHTSWVEAAGELRYHLTAALQPGPAGITPA